MYCCWKTEPKPSHCSIRHHQSYEAFYHKAAHDEFTQICASLLGRESPGPILEEFIEHQFPLDEALLYNDEQSKKWMHEPLQGLVVLNDTLCTKEKLQELRDKEDGWEKHGFGFDQADIGVQVTADDYLPGLKNVIRNGYRAFVNLPTVSEMCNILTTGEDLMIANECVKLAIARILARIARDNNQQTSATIVSLPVVENSSGYKRQKPVGSPTRSRATKKTRQW
jgi:hypothetical protein